MVYNWFNVVKEEPSLYIWKDFENDLGARDRCVFWMSAVMTFDAIMMAGEYRVFQTRTTNLIQKNATCSWPKASSFESRRSSGKRKEVLDVIAGRNEIYQL